MAKETNPPPDPGRQADEAGKKGVALLVAMGLGLASEAGLIHLMSAHGDFLRQSEASKFTAYGVAAGMAYWLAASCATQTKFSTRQAAGVFWLVAVALRMAILPVVPGDDLWRYRWEGLIQLHGFNPYAAGPESPALVDLRNADWSKINHRSYPAIYPPLTEALFAVIAAAGNAVWLYKVIFALADLASIAVLRRLLVRTGVPIQQAAWYAWNPLVIYAFAGAAHFDSLMILALLGAVWALQAGAASSARGVHGDVATGVPRLCGLSALLLGLAIAIKIAPLALLPVWVVALRSWRRVAMLAPVAFAPLAVSALAYGFPWVPVFATLRQFGVGFRVNDPVWWLLAAMGGSHRSENNVLPGGCALVAGAALAYGFRHDWRRGLLWVWGAALLLSPVVHAWYVVWVLPLAAWRGQGARAWFVFSISTFGYFLLWEVNHTSGKPWQEPLWLRLAILLPPLVAAAWTGVVQRREVGPGAGQPKSLNSDGPTTTIPA